MTIENTDTRDEHMAWAKQRALAYLDRGDCTNALASFVSDIRKHPETDTPAVNMLLAGVGFPLAAAGDVEGLRKHIEGYA